MSEAYPNSHVFGTFPNKSIENLCSAIEKRKAELVSLRNTKNVRSSSIEGLLLGPSQPMTMIGYEPKKKFSMGESGSSIIDGFHPKMRIAVEVEKGRVLLGNQIYLDLYKFIAIDEIEYGVLVVPTVSREGAERPFERCVIKLKVLEDKLEGLGIKGLAVIGY